MDDPTPVAEAKSSVQIWRSKEGVASWNVRVFAGDTQADVEHAMDLAIEADARLQEQLRVS